MDSLPLNPFLILVKASSLMNDTIQASGCVGYSPKKLVGSSPIAITSCPTGSPPTLGEFSGESLPHPGTRIIPPCSGGESYESMGGEMKMNYRVKVRKNFKNIRRASSRSLDSDQIISDG